MYLILKQQTNLNQTVQNRFLYKEIIFLIDSLIKEHDFFPFANCQAP